MHIIAKNRSETTQVAGQTEDFSNVEKVQHRDAKKDVCIHVGYPNIALHLKQWMLRTEVLSRT
eukprot:1141842-Pelagomonas_calceolata.AAC.3